MKKITMVVSLIFVLASWSCLAGQFDASVVRGGKPFFKIHPKVFVASAWFNDEGIGENIPDLSQLFCIDSQLEFYYGITDSLIGIDDPLMAGILLPVGYVKSSYDTGGVSSTTKVKNPWIIIKHQFLSAPVMSAFSLRVKLPITEIEPLEISRLNDGSKIECDMDDKQVDIYPIYYVDWLMPWATYIYTQIGYKYRMKSDEIKPSNELKLVIETGYNIDPDRIYMFTISDYTRFFGGEINGEKDRSSAGYLYTIATGIRFFLWRDFQMEILTNATPYGKNQFRGIGGHVGVRCGLGM